MVPPYIFLLLRALPIVDILLYFYIVALQMPGVWSHGPACQTGHFAANSNPRSPERIRQQVNQSHPLTLNTISISHSSVACFASLCLFPCLHLCSCPLVSTVGGTCAFAAFLAWAISVRLRFCNILARAISGQ